MPLPPPPIQVVPEEGAADPSVIPSPSVEAEGPPSSPAQNPTCVKKTFAKIQYQYELNIDPPEQDPAAKRDIMRYIADNLKMEYKFNGKQLFVFSPMNVTDPDEGKSSGEENPNPVSFSVEGIKTSEKWDDGKYETNMMIRLKKRRQALEVVQDDPGQNEELETEMAQVEEERGPFKFIQKNKLELAALGMVLALLVGLAGAFAYLIDI